MKRQSIWKLFKLPTPSDLGMTKDTKYNSLPMRFSQSSQDTEPTWEDWEEKVKREYPIRFFFAEQCWPYLKAQYRRWIVDPLYWVKCHVLSKHKHHMLDLRQSKTKMEPFPYRYGWIDADTKMVFALFNILNLFVEHELPRVYIPSEEEVLVEPHLSSHRNNYLEVKAIHYWWNMQRLIDQEIENELLHEWSAARKTDDPDTKKIWAKLDQLEIDNKEKLEEMLLRLIKIRGCLWT